MFACSEEKRRRRKRNGVLGVQADKLLLILMIIDKYVCFILCFFHILLISYYVSFIFCSFHFIIDVLNFSCLFYYDVKKIEESASEEFPQEGQGWNTKVLFQGSSSSSSRHQALIRAVQADF
jgi:hypothetical protein